ncbi:MAG: response regulator [Nanoarchaeota archaeon]|nr:response regulator [Nanoarchaeota archaeon]
MTSVLIVEDVPSWIETETDFLKSLDYDVSSCFNATEALKILKEKQFDLVISDLHMGGPEANGDYLLEQIIENNIPIRFALASGTMTPMDKDTFRENIPFIGYLSKDDFHDRTGLNKDNIAYILLQGIPDYSKLPNRNRYVDWLKQFKERPAPDGIRIYADRVKGRILRLARHFEKELSAIPSENGNVYQLLSNYSFFGPEERQPGIERKTKINLHTMKNLLKDLGERHLDNCPELKQEVLSVSDEIAVLINIPNERDMSLSEVVNRAKSNLAVLFNDSMIQGYIQPNIMVDNPGPYIDAIHLLMENALEAVAQKSWRSIYLKFDKGRLIIENDGALPDFIDGDGNPILDRIRSSKSFGTGYGIKTALNQIEQAGGKLTYKTGAKTVQAILEIPTYSRPYSFPSGVEKKVLFYDHSGQRFSFLESMDHSGELPGCQVEFHLRGGFDGFKEIDFKSYDIIFAHVGGLNSAFAEKLAKENPKAKLIMVSGSYENELTISDASWYSTYREFMGGPLGPRIYENATWFREAPGMETIKSIIYF